MMFNKNMITPPPVNKPLQLINLEITCRAITLLPFELQTSCSVNLDQNAEIDLHARRELHPPKPGCDMNVRSPELCFSRRSSQRLRKIKDGDAKA